MGFFFLEIDFKFWKYQYWVCVYVNLPKNYDLCQFLVKKWSRFQQNSTKLRNKALIGKKCRNKSWRKLNLSSENVNMEYVRMLVCQENYVLCQFLGKNGQNFNKKSTKLLNEALIGKMYKNKSWRKLKLSSENVYIENVYMLVSLKNGVLCQFLQFFTKWPG